MTLIGIQAFNIMDSHFWARAPGVLCTGHPRMQIFYEDVYKQVWNYYTQYLSPLIRDCICSLQTIANSTKKYNHSSCPGGKKNGFIKYSIVLVTQLIIQLYMYYKEIISLVFLVHSYKCLQLFYIVKKTTKVCIIFRVSWLTPTR